MQWDEKLWQRSVDQFAGFVESLAAGLGRRERREGVVLYVQGLSCITLLRLGADVAEPAPSAEFRQVSVEIPRR